MGLEPGGRDGKNVYYTCMVLERRIPRDKRSSGVAYRVDYIPGLGLQKHQEAQFKEQ